MTSNRHQAAESSSTCPLSFMDASPGAEEETSWIDMNNRRAFERAANLLLDLGHKRIALLNGLEQMDFARRRRQRVSRRRLTERGLTPDPATDAQRGHDRALSAVTMRWRCSGARQSADSLSGLIDDLGHWRCPGRWPMRPDGPARTFPSSPMTTPCPSCRTAAKCRFLPAPGRPCAMPARRRRSFCLNMIADPLAKPASLHLDAELIIGQSTGPAPA